MKTNENRFDQFEPSRPSQTFEALSGNQILKTGADCVILRLYQLSRIRFQGDKEFAGDGKKTDLVRIFLESSLDKDVIGLFSSHIPIIFSGSNRAAHIFMGSQGFPFQKFVLLSRQKILYSVLYSVRSGFVVFQCFGSRVYSIPFAVSAAIFFYF